MLTVATGMLPWFSLGTVWMFPALFLYGTVFAFSESAYRIIVRTAGRRSTAT